MEKPQLSPDEAIELVHGLFGLKVNSIKKFDGYDDLNYHIKVDVVSKNPLIPHPSENGYVLKISNGCFTQQPELLAIQNRLMTYLDGQLEDVSVPTPQATLTGDTLTFVNLPWKKPVEKESKFIVRLLSFTPGNMLLSIQNEPRMNILLETGRMVARMTNAFRKLDVSADIENNLPIASSMLWSLEGICSEYLEPRLKAVDDPKRLNAFKQVIADFCQTMEKIRMDSSLDRGIIHNDVNEGNLVLQSTDENTPTASYSLKGLIDFGDIQISYRIFELIVAMMYMMLEAQSKGTMDPVDAGGYVLAGYLSINTLTATERSLLKIGIEARCTQSLVIGMYTYIYEQPGNEYVLNTQKKGWAVLEMLHQMSERELFAKWDSVISRVIGQTCFSSPHWDA